MKIVDLMIVNKVILIADKIHLNSTHIKKLDPPFLLIHTPVHIP